MTVRVRILAAMVFAATAGLATAHAEVPQDRELCVGGDGGSPLRLRAGPSTAHPQVGSLPAGACGIRVAGRCADGWCEVELGGARGWADARFVVVREGGRVVRGGGSLIGAPAIAAPAPAPAPQVEAARPTPPQKSQRPGPERASRPEAVRESVTAETKPPVPARQPVAAAQTKASSGSTVESIVEEGEAPPEATPARPAVTPRAAFGRTTTATRTTEVEPPQTRRERRLARRAARLAQRRYAHLRPLPMPRASLLGGPRGGRLACVTRVWPGDTLRIRTGPGVGHREIAGIYPGACGVVVGRHCVGNWCRVNYRGVKGWSNAYYLRPMIAVR